MQKSIIKTISKCIPGIIKEKILLFLLDTKYFGIKIAFVKYLASISQGRVDRVSRRIVLAKHAIIKKYIKSKSGFEKEKIDFTINSMNELHQKRNIWMMWWQGEEHAPEIITQCINSVRIHARNAKVNVISQNNISFYIDIPDSIMNLVNNKQLSLTHLSDLIRVCLLEKYGGLWIDASLYCIKDIPEQWFEFPIFSRKMKNDDITFVSNYKWTVGLMGGEKNYPLFTKVHELFVNYIINEKYFIDYFVLDYLISIIYDSSEYVKKDIDTIPENNGMWSYMDSLWNMEYNKKEFEQLKLVHEDVYFLYISWKGNYRKQTTDGKPTYYKMLSRGRLN